MWKDLKKSLNFTRGQRKTIFFLSLLIIILLLIRISLPAPSDDFSFDKETAARIDSFLQNNPAPSHRKKESITHHATRRKTRWNPKPFDPNSLPLHGWLDYGLTLRQAQTIRKYIAAGGRFRRKEDLRKIYVISPDEYNKIEKYIVIVEQNKTSQAVKQKDTVKTIVKPKNPDAGILLPLNSCTREQLMKIRGIGPAISKGIVSYRRLLGGYYSLNQLLEVYSIDSAKWLAIKGHFTVNPDSIKKMNLNTAAFYELKRHPYISRKLASEIFNHARYESRFRKVEDLKSLSSVNDSVYKKIYLYFVAK